MSDKSHLLFILFFDCTEDVCVQRCLSRGEAGSGRTDDNLESLKKRIVTYTDSTKPIIDHYDDLGLVRKVCAAGSPDQVFEQVKKFFDAVKSK
jgi:UMP-CMP kinase